ncbi:sulfite exporter TauE/SafE family protein [Gilvimarinus algae]|uniref:Probable membrane transporter protein n=1 Tax=Gilvimarinus algae TaxID=3058037 RepID=A0ABT8THC3_9GAMM|nr:sulfite exporter TauE/SafE family protein [Gilvimarinus sp. SDUM040014]MDO3383316.1 sulfite exporter TauE/SafE family protein [Gilvimarinus sp. SDUM040014]
MTICRPERRQLQPPGSSSLSDITLIQILLANLALIAGSCLQGVAGYGIGTLSAPLMFLISPAFLPGVMIINAVILNILMLIRNHQSLSFRPVRYAIGGNVVGTALAAITLTILTAQGFELVFGVLILLAVGLSVLGLKPGLSARNSMLAGGASGYMGTITAVGGPPIALIYQNEPGELVRANLSAFFLFASLASVVALAPAGYIGMTEMTLVFATCPGVFIGFWLSGHLVTRLPFNALRPVILSIAAMAGVAAVVRGVLAY